MWKLSKKKIFICWLILIFMVIIFMIGKRIFRPLHIKHGIKAEEYHNKKMYKEARIELNKAISYKPLSDFYNMRGNGYMREEKYKNAITDYSESIKLEASDPSGYYNRGCGYAMLEFYDKALKDSLKSIELSTTQNVKTHLLKIDILVKMKADTQYIINEIDKSLLLFPNNKEFDEFIYLKECYKDKLKFKEYERNKDYKSALLLSVQCMKKAKGRDKVKWLLQTSKYKNKIDGGIEYLEKAIELNSRLRKDGKVYYEELNSNFQR